jgi:hypothetical protein
VGREGAVGSWPRGSLSPLRKLNATRLDRYYPMADLYGMAQVPTQDSTFDLDRQVLHGIPLQYANGKSQWSLRQFALDVGAPGLLERVGRE